MESQFKRETQNPMALGLILYRSYGYMTASHGYSSNYIIKECISQQSVSLKIHG